MSKTSQPFIRLASLRFFAFIVLAPAINKRNVLSIEKLTRPPVVLWRMMEDTLSHYEGRMRPS